MSAHITCLDLWRRILYYRNSQYIRCFSLSGILVYVNICRRTTDEAIKCTQRNIESSANESADHPKDPEFEGAVYHRIGAK